MNILHLDEQRTWRGGEQQASWLIQGLAKRGHTVAIAGRPSGEFVKHEHGGVECKRFPLPLRGEADIFSAWQLARIVREHNIDLIHAHSSHAHMLACLARRFAPDTKVVVSRRVSFPPKPNAITRWKYAMPDKFLAVSGEVKRVLHNYGIPEERIALVYSSVDFARLDVDPISRAELNVPESAPLLVTAGALVGHKDHANFLDAFHRVRAEIPDAHAVIAGEGELRPQLEHQAAELALGDSIHFVGHRDDAPAIIRAADVYVSSSWSEGLGTSVLEALACGTPVVAAEAGGIPEMVLHGKTGYLVPNQDPIALADSIEISLHDRDTARRMAEAGQRFVRENFSVDGMVEGTIRVYQELLSAV